MKLGKSLGFRLGLGFKLQSKFRLVENRVFRFQKVLLLCLFIVKFKIEKGALEELSFRDFQFRTVYILFEK